MTRQHAMEIAARVWCKPFCSKIVFDADLCTGFADTLLEHCNEPNVEGGCVNENMGRFQGYKGNDSKGIIRELEIWALKWPIGTIGGKGDFEGILEKYRVGPGN